MGRLNSLFGTSGYLSATYTSIGQPSTYTRSGTTEMDTAYGYDAGTGAVTDVNQSTLVGSTSTSLSASHYTYDNSGDVKSISATSASTSTDTQCFTYDYQQDLTAAWTPTSNSCAAAPTSSMIGGPAPYWSSYVIDPTTGNRSSTTQNAITTGGTATSHTYTYPAAGAARPHAVGTVTNVTGGTTTTSSYGYDTAGDTTTRPGQTLTYDATGKPATVVAGSNTQTLIHDASGALLLESDPVSGSTLYLGATELHLAAGSSTVTAVRTYTANGTPIAERTTAAGVSGSIVTLLGADAQNTVGVEVAAVAGTVTRRYADPFGNTRGSTVTWSDSHGYLNAPQSPFSGLTTLGARQYDTTIGRFLTVDSVLSANNPQQNDGYAYSRNDPVSLTDPTGSCYVASLGAINHQANCAGGKGQTAAAAENGSGAPDRTAAAPGFVQVSPHFQISTKNAHLYELMDRFNSEESFNNFGRGGVNSIVQEVITWRGVCDNISDICGKSFMHELDVASFPGVPGHKEAIAALAAGGLFYIRRGGQVRIPNSVLARIDPVLVHGGIPGYVVPIGEMEGIMPMPLGSLEEDNK